MIVVGKKIVQNLIGYSHEIIRIRHKFGFLEKKVRLDDVSPKLKFPYSLFASENGWPSIPFLVLLVFSSSSSSSLLCSIDRSVPRWATERERDEVDVEPIFRGTIGCTSCGNRRVFQDLGDRFRFLFRR
ncbi:hypothetical protein QJS04_geneDACA015340 [Acorus gramineus]|uniref:Uncharacterized protein n=1 Tax=Acorus gramineus TaxID=55184 RepID=A0AAV9AQ73_ACOGR|nr:hypothetical protein QJS04_geneDACA015340 [Acorus gramineus]